MYEPPAVVPKSKQQDILKLSRTLNSTNVGRFILYCAFINLTVYLAGPFFSVYMLRDLKFSYLTYVIIGSTASLVTLLCMPYWGKRIDRFGNIKVLKITSLIIPLVPILWLVSANVYYLCFAQVVSGFAWAGFNLATSIFLYDAAPSENRTRYIALNNALMYGGISLGALLGGIIAPHMPTIKQSSLLTMFLLSGLARLAVVFIFTPRISEVRQVPKVNTKELLLSGINPDELKSLPDATLKSIDKLWRNRHH
jgi:MFS family permease